MKTQEAQVNYKQKKNMKKTPWHIIIKLLKTNAKEKIVRAAREEKNQVMEKKNFIPKVALYLSLFPPM